MAAITCAGEAVGLRCQIDSCGASHMGRRHRCAAQRAREASSLLVEADVISAPGAKMSTQAPLLENEARASLFVEAPAVIASSTTGRRGGAGIAVRVACRHGKGNPLGDGILHCSIQRL